MDTVILTVEYQTETDDAVCVEYEGTEKWLPKSTLVNWDEDCNERGDFVNIEFSQWKAEELGWT